MKRLHSYFFALLSAALVFPAFSQAVPAETAPSAAVSLASEVRTGTYKAVEPVVELTARLMTHNYDIYENPTGIWFNGGDKAVVTMKGAGERPVKLYVIDFIDEKPNRSTYDLKEGVNELTISKPGLAYINYEATDYKDAPDVTVTVEGGVVNGVFRAGDSDADWKELLKNAKAETIDLYGDRVHLVFPVKALREFCPEKGAELLALYDKMIETEQKLVGIEHQGERPRNHMLGRVVHRGHMFADGTGVGFNLKTMKGVLSMESLMNPANITFGFWGIGHEFGHINQTRPGFRWLGTIEVTNNLMAMVCCYELNKPILRLEREVYSDGKTKLPGGYYNSFTNYGLLKGEKWQMQDSERYTGHPQVGGGNVFVKLIPLWQVYLYCSVAEMGNKNFYADFNNWLRQDTSTPNKEHGKHQLNFVKMACELNKQDLTDYFEAVGMLQPIDTEMKDYGSGHLLITEEECKAVKEFASKYPKPKTPLIQYLNANNVEIYKDRLPLTGPDKPFNKVKTDDKSLYEVSHKIWKNVVAFETYEGDKLVYITLAGVGAPAYGDPVTKVYLPEGATEIKAVGWDGERKAVFKK